MEPSLYLVHISQIMKSKMSARAGKQYLVDYVWQQEICDQLQD